MAVMLLAACRPLDTSNQNLYQPVPTVVEPGLAYGQPCSPPCWRGLVPNKSTSTDVAKAIEQLGASGWAKSIEGNPNTGFFARPSLLTNQGTVGVYVDNGIVHHIFGNLLFDYSVRELVDQIGEPDNLYFVYRGQPLKPSCSERDFKGPIQSAPVVILYPSRGMVFLISAPFTAVGLICPEMKILAFCYYTPLPIQEALKDDNVSNQCGIEALRGITEKDLVKWHGFGSGY